MFPRQRQTWVGFLRVRRAMCFCALLLKHEIKLARRSTYTESVEKLGGSDSPLLVYTRSKPQCSCRILRAKRAFVSSFFSYNGDRKPFVLHERASHRFCTSHVCIRVRTCTQFTDLTRAIRSKLDFLQFRRSVRARSSRASSRISRREGILSARGKYVC